MCWDVLFSLRSLGPVAASWAGIIVIVRVSLLLPDSPGKAGSPSPSSEMTCPSYAPAVTVIVGCSCAFLCSHLLSGEPLVSASPCYSLSSRRRLQHALHMLQITRVGGRGT